jgi:DNA modification methylase
MPRRKNTRSLSEAMLKFQEKTIYEVLGREPVHPFPARMAPGIALQAVMQVKEPARILDPMMGSGTVLAMARSRGHRGIGFDIDPLAVLISKVWTNSFEAEAIRECGREVLMEARATFKTMSQADAYPHNADKETRGFVSYWFDGYARRQLSSLSRAIGNVKCDKTRDVLWCAFSRLIISKQAGASLAMDLSHSRPHRVFEHAPGKPFRKFRSALERVVANIIDRKSRGRGPTPSIGVGDARALPLSDNSVDLVLTSPPYLNAIDYIRCSKFSLIWMGYNLCKLKTLRAESVGTEAGKNFLLEDSEVSFIVEALNLRPQLDSRHRGILARYIDDMRRAINEVCRVLSRGGKAVYVIGENTIRGTYVRTSVIVSILAESAGLRLKDRRTRTLPSNRRYMPPPSSGYSGGKIEARMRREVVLAFVK